MSCSTIEPHQHIKTINHVIILNISVNVKLFYFQNCSLEDCKFNCPRFLKSIQLKLSSLFVSGLENLARAYILLTWLIYYAITIIIKHFSKTI